MLEIKYDHKKVEEGKYEYWLNNNYFMSGDKKKTPFSSDAGFNMLEKIINKIAKNIFITNRKDDVYVR